MGATESGFYGHTGGDPGVVTLLFFDSDSKTGRVVLVNTHIDGTTVTALNQLWQIWDTLDTFKGKF